MSEAIPAPRPVHVIRAWDAADAVITQLAQDDPTWLQEPHRERLHRTVYLAVLGVLETQNNPSASSEGPLCACGK